MSNRWYLAFNYGPDEALSEKVLKRTQDYLLPTNLDASVMRFHSSGIDYYSRSWCIAVICLETPPPSFIDGIRQINRQGEETSLPERVIEQLFTSRQRNIKGSQQRDPSKGFLYERHGRLENRGDGYNLLPEFPDEALLSYKDHEGVSHTEKYPLDEAVVELAREGLSSEAVEEVLKDSLSEGFSQDVLDEVFPPSLYFPPEMGDERMSDGVNPPPETLPFLTAYLQRRTLQNMLKHGLDPDEVGLEKASRRLASVSALDSIFLTMIEEGEKYFFTPSALSMHKAVYDPEAIEWIDPHLPTWIELSSPVPYRDHSLKAFSVYPKFPKETIDKAIPVSSHPVLNKAVSQASLPLSGIWSIEALLPNTIAPYHFTYSTHEDKFIFLSTHQCPYKRCKLLIVSDEKSFRESFPLEISEVAQKWGALEPCEECMRDLCFISSWVHTALLMVQKHYALSPSPVDFPIRDRGYEEETSVPVKPHNKKKAKRGEISYKKVKKHVPLLFKMISYEVSVKEETPEERVYRERGSRLNWFQQTDRGDIIYVHHDITPHDRRYKGDHYRALIERVLSGETVREGGYEYTLETLPDGTPQVRGKVFHPKGRYVPMKRQRDTIKKVTAKVYKDLEKK